jgi:hypothetical protein
MYVISKKTPSVFLGLVPLGRRRLYTKVKFGEACSVRRWIPTEIE